MSTRFSEIFIKFIGNFFTTFIECLLSHPTNIALDSKKSVYVFFVPIKVTNFSEHSLMSVSEGLRTQGPELFQ